MLLRSWSIRPAVWRNVGLAFLVAAIVLTVSPRAGLVSSLRGHDFVDGLLFGVAIGCLLVAFRLRLARS